MIALAGIIMPAADLPSFCRVASTRYEILPLDGSRLHASLTP
ncbi:hypothetical protein [Lichenicoccus sp.]